MRFSHIDVIILAAGTASFANAHTTFTNFFVDGVDQGDGTAVRMSNNIAEATYPLPNITTPDMACGKYLSNIALNVPLFKDQLPTETHALIKDSPRGTYEDAAYLGSCERLTSPANQHSTGVNGETGVSRIASVKASSNLTFEWRSWPDASHPGSIDISHKGPCAVYMKKVVDSSASNNAAGDGWFKVMEDGYDSVAGKWCTEKLIANAGHLSATIPKDLPAGYYLVRPELLALHQADKTPPDPQFYVGCAQIFLNSNGSASPPNTVAIPGYVNMSTPAMNYDIWTVPLKLPFPDFGPPLYTSNNAKRSLKARTISQTIGLKPDGCVMENANWCGFLPPSYADANSCYTVKMSYLFSSHSQC